MSNERIDLEEYEGHTLEGLTPELLEEAGFEQSNAKLIAALPDLIAELKRMYEEEDKLLYLIEVIFEYPHSNIAAAVAKRKASE